MKKLSLLFLLIPVFASSQNVWFNSLSKDSTLIMANTIVSMAKHKFSLFKVTEAVKHGDYQVYRYVSDSTKLSSKPEFVDVSFQLVFEGRNIDLETKGIPRYYFKSIPKIKLLDVAAFWKYSVDENFDIATMKGEQEKKIKKEGVNNSYKKVMLSPEGEGYWNFNSF